MDKIVDFILQVFYAGPEAVVMFVLCAIMALVIGVGVAELFVELAKRIFK